MGETTYVEEVISKEHMSRIQDTSAVRSVRMVSQMEMYMVLISMAFLIWKVLPM